MNKVYTSKNDIFIFIVICMIGASAASFKAAMESGAFLSWLTVLLVVVICVAVFLLLYPTRYIIDGDDLLIRYGFQRKRISISQIIYVRRSHNGLASPALSLDRLEIIFNGKSTDSILISPHNRKNLWKTLRR